MKYCLVADDGEAQVVVVESDDAKLLSSETWEKGVKV